MKLITRSTIALVFLIGLATPLLAQVPNVAVRINSPTQNCFPVTVKNLQTSTLNLQAAYVTIFDQSTCKITCEFKITLGKKLDPCKTLDFKICCQKPLPPKYICYVRVVHNSGSNEEWYFRP